MKKGELYFTKNELEDFQKAPFAQVLFVVKNLIPVFEKDPSDFVHYNELKNTYSKLESMLQIDDLWLDDDGDKILFSAFRLLPQANRKTVMSSLGAFRKILSNNLKIETGDKLKEIETVYNCISETYQKLIDNSESILGYGEHKERSMAEKKDWKKQLPFIGDFELGIHKKPVKNLADILANFTIPQLKTFFDSYNVDEADIPSKKAELVNAASKLITENCVRFLMFAEGITFEFYQQYLNCRNSETGVCEAELYVPDPKDYIDGDKAEIFMYIMKSGLVKLLLQKGLLFKFDTRTDELFVIPDEVYEEVTRHIQKDGTHPFGSMFERKEFADMLLSIYGVLTVRDFKILWETAFPEQKITKEEIIDFMSFSSRDDDAYNFHKSKNALSHILLDEEQTQEILDDRAGYTLFVPSQKELLGWLEESKNPGTDDAFDANGKVELEYKNPYFIQMKKILEKARKKDGDADEILTDIMFYIKDGFKITQVIDILNDDYELTATMSKREAERFFQTYQELHNSTRLWVNYGSAPNDLACQKTPDLRLFSSNAPVMQNPPNVIPFPKVGRNEPCPCGSGKKFKHCHGR